MPTLPSLDSILADKTQASAPTLRPVRAPEAAIPTSSKSETKVASTPEPIPEPNPLYTERPLEKAEYADWLAAGRLYALIDGHNQPDLAGQINQRHPGQNTALYQGPFGEQHSAETPRFTQLDTALHEQLQATIQQNPGWGWSLIPRAEAEPSHILQQLIDHYSPWSWAATPKGETWLFRLHDPRVIQNWLHSAAPNDIERFLAPLQHLILLGSNSAKVLTPGTEPAPLTQQLPLAPWSADSLDALNAIGQEQLLTRFEEHLQTQHPNRIPTEPTEQRSWVVNQANRAYRYGLHDEQSLIKYLSLSAVLGPKFDQGETGTWAHNILKGPALQGTQNRIDRLIQAATERLQTSSGNSA